MWDVIIFLLIAVGGVSTLVTAINVITHHQTYQLVTRDTESIEAAHSEWQTRVNYFYVLGSEAEKTKDWLAARIVAENLDFLLETEPPRPDVPTTKRAPVQPDRGTESARPGVANPPQQTLGIEELWGRIERKAEIYRREDQSHLGFCNVCASQLENEHFQRHQVAGICDPCYDDTYKGDL